MHKIQLQLEKIVKKDDLLYQLNNIRDMCEYAIDTISNSTDEQMKFKVECLNAQIATLNHIFGQYRLVSDYLVMYKEQALFRRYKNERLSWLLNVQQCF